MDDIKNKVLHTARELFLQQGYKKTTIRQIVDKSGVLIGSIYYFFENKEDIFKSLILDIFDYADQYVADKLVKDANSIYRYCVTCALELIAVDADEHIAELYFEGYSSNTILDSLAKHAAKRSQVIFKDYTTSFTFEDYYIKTMAIKGVMRSFIALSMIGANITLGEKINAVTDISLHAFCVPDDEIKVMKDRIFDNIDDIKKGANEFITKEMT